MRSASQATNQNNARAKYFCNPYERKQTLNIFQGDQ